MTTPDHHHGDTGEPDHHHDPYEHVDDGDHHAGIALDDELPQASPRLRRQLAAAVAVAALLVVLALARLWPYGFTTPDQTANSPASTENVNATVTRVEAKPCAPGSKDTCYALAARLADDAGADAGQVVDLPDLSAGSTDRLPRLDDAIVVSRVTIIQTGQRVYNYSDFQRSRPLWILALLFAAAVVAVARWRGAAAIVGMGLSYLVLVTFVIPALLNGESPLAVALTGAAVVAFVVLYIAHGVNARTTIALLGTLASLLLTGALAIAFVGLTRVTGLASEEAASLATLGIGIDASGLLLAGIVIGTLGVLTDITVTQAAVVWEVHAANPTMTARQLLTSGMRTGRDHIASTVYTLVLAYAGAAMPLLVLFALAHQQVSDIITSEIIAEELVRTLLGSLGLVASVPITTALTALVASRSEPRRPPADLAPTVPDLLPADLVPPAGSQP